jgi:hypothetical protein
MELEDYKPHAYFNHSTASFVKTKIFPRGFRPSKGHLVLFGLTNGSVPPFDINRLSGITGSGNRGSLFLTGAFAKRGGRLEVAPEKPSAGCPPTRASISSA